MGGNDSVDVDEIRHRAFVLWNQDGCPEGRAVDYWLRAEAELAAGAAAPEPAQDPPRAPDEPTPAPRPARRAGKAKSGVAESGPAPEPAAAAPSKEVPGERRDTLVQQRRTRRKAEG